MILKLRFGIDDGRQRTLEEVGKVYGVTRERIRQIEEKALQKMRKSKKNTLLFYILKLFFQCLFSACSSPCQGRRRKSVP